MIEKHQPSKNININIFYPLGYNIPNKYSISFRVQYPQ